MLKGKTVLLGVSGSIAAYKTVGLARLLKKQHAAVHVPVSYTHLYLHKKPITQEVHRILP